MSVGSGRLLRSELRMVFGRRRNQLLLLLTGLFPLLIGIALRVAAPHAGTLPRGPNHASLLYAQLAGNGVYLAFTALSTLLILVLPVVVTVVGGDSIAGESGYGTLRYLLTVPAGRTRLLAAKLTSTVVFALSATILVSAVALAAGAALFPVGPVTMLSGATVPLTAGLVRLLLVTLYVVAAMATLGALALAVSTLTEHSLVAIASVAVAVVTSEVLDSVAQLGWLAPYLPTHWWLSFDALLRVPVDTATVGKGLTSFAIYLALAVVFAWARFGSADVTS